jgi:hypothetical protein
MASPSVRISGSQHSQDGRYQFAAPGIGTLASRMGISSDDSPASAL